MDFLKRDPLVSHIRLLYAIQEDLFLCILGKTLDSLQVTHRRTPHFVVSFINLLVFSVMPRKWTVVIAY
jgi:hypothetical protein